MFVFARWTTLVSVIEIEFDGDDAVAGWVRTATTARLLPPVIEIRFSGWAGLLEAVLALRSRDRLPQRNPPDFDP